MVAQRILVGLSLTATLSAQTTFEIDGKRHLPADRDPVRVVVDIDRDGDPDILAASGAILLNDGTARFTADGSLAALGDGAVAANFDADPELEVVAFGPDPIYFDPTSVLQFVDATGTRFPDLTSIGFAHAVAGDIDDDGDVDIVVDGVAEDFAVLENDGTGHFTLVGTPLSTPAFDGERTNFLVDIDNDDDLDFVRLANTDVHPNARAIWRNDGNTFTVVQFLPDTTAVADIVAADFDGDGNVDLISVSGEASPKMSLWRNDGAGSFAVEPGVFETSNLTLSAPIAIFDAHNDGDPDVFVAPDVVIVNDNGSGDAARVPVLANAPALVTDRAVARVADFDLDGRDDLLRGQATLLLNTTLGTAPVDPVMFTRITSIDASSAGAVAAADVDGDGDTDLYRKGAIEIRQDDMTWSRRAIPFHGTRTPMFVDVDHDGDLDLFGGEGQILINDGTGLYFDDSALRLPVLAGTWSAYDAGDLDGDGATDLVVTHGASHSVLWNNGNGFFSAAPLSSGTLTSLRIGHIDDDGLLDVFAGGLMINQGGRVFANETVDRMPATFALFPFPGNVWDVNDDGLLDVVDFFRAVLENDGTGHFDYTLQQVEAVGPTARFDFDLDGDRDALTSPFLDGILTGTGSPGTTDLVLERILDWSTFQFFITDIDDDGDPDAITSEFTLINQHWQLVAPFKPRPGSNYEVEMRFGPSNVEDARLVGILFGLAPARVSLFDWGDLRIAPTTLIGLHQFESLAPGEPTASLTVEVPVDFPVGSRFFSQALFADSSSVRFSNLVSDVVE